MNDYNIQYFDSRSYLLELANMVIRASCYDDETGEVITYDVNDETGEPDMDTNIPPIYNNSRETISNAQPSRYMKFPKCYMSKTKKFQSLKEQILSGSNKISQRLLLIPTLAFFPAYMCTFIVLLEVFLHVRCHMKNKRLTDTSIYYQSPFHTITSIFCGVCRDCDTTSKIGKFQEKRRRRHTF
ncbi:unnamed protein product [Diatraea saccharalis]|uniref:Uncharacterized protein n=1 Tax=Diatraea saccharalis TaxID=40085 RepID=A0A9N9N0P5_9NEOP|nr:unnamed protein product [Diatraea saccharalis]